MHKLYQQANELSKVVIEAAALRDCRNIASFVL